MAADFRTTGRLSVVLDIASLRVAIPPEVERVIRTFARESKDGNETGGILLGRGPDQSGVIDIVQAGDAGPAAVRQPRLFSRDTAHAEALASEAWRRERAEWVGEWHTHPEAGPEPSELDLASYAKVLSDPELSFDCFVAVIVTGGPSGWTDAVLTPWILAR